MTASNASRSVIRTLGSGLSGILAQSIGGTGGSSAPAASDDEDDDDSSKKAEAEESSASYKADVA